MTGYVINIYGKSFWHNSTGSNPNNTTYLINTAINSFIAAFAGTPVVAASSEGTANALEGASATSTGVYNWVTTGVPSTPTTVPRAYINWILFNEQFVPISSNCGYDMVYASPDYVKSHSDAVTIGTGGYLYIYCSNESNIDVYFDNLQVIQTRGPLLETNSYYGFGLLMAGISDKAVKINYAENKYRYNGKEMQHQEFSDGSGLEKYDYGARMQDPQLGRWWCLDPLSEKYFSLSPYVYTADNPVKYIDPDGKDFILNIQRKKGKIVGVSISSTVYIEGDGASSEKAEELTRFASNILQTQYSEGIKVSFNVKYVFDKSKTTKSLKAGENIINFRKEKEDFRQNHRSEVIGLTEPIADGVRSLSGNYATVFGSGKNNTTVLHETMHLLGLSDRYDESNNSLTYDMVDEPQKGFEHDIMSTAEHILNIFYYKLYRIWGIEGSKIFNSDVIPLNRAIDKDVKGRLQTPYEANKYHTNLYEDK